MLLLLWFGHNWQSLQEVLDYIAMCCCNKSISFSKTKTTGRNIWIDILICIHLLLKVVWTTLTNVHYYVPTNVVFFFGYVLGSKLGGWLKPRTTLPSHVLLPLIYCSYSFAAPAHVLHPHPITFRAVPHRLHGIVIFKVLIVFQISVTTERSNSKTLVILI